MMGRRFHRRRDLVGLRPRRLGARRSRLLKRIVPTGVAPAWKRRAAATHRWRVLKSATSQPAAGVATARAAQAHGKPQKYQPKIIVLAGISRIECDRWLDIPRS
jgi:hypothetical protein